VRAFDAGIELSRGICAGRALQRIKTLAEIVVFSQASKWELLWVRS